jgi:class 3 adenylate cyclase
VATQTGERLEEVPGTPEAQRRAGSAEYACRVPVEVFLFTDIEGSTRLWADHPGQMGAALAQHDAVVARAVSEAGGRVFKHTGDGACVVFPSVWQALAAALAVQRGLAAQDWGPVGTVGAPMAVHAGEAEERDGDWFGPALNRTARLLGIGHGGQVLVSGAAHELATDSLSEALSFADLGLHRLRDLSHPEHVWQLVADGLDRDFPRLPSLLRCPARRAAGADHLLRRTPE